MTTADDAGAPWDSSNATGGTPDANTPAWDSSNDAAQPAAVGASSSSDFDPTGSDTDPAGH
jgi:hypothetical protein